MMKSWGKNALLLGALVLAPVFREIIFGVISSHHTPFHSIEDIAHTISESLVMLVLGLLYLSVDKRYAVNKSKEIKLTQAASIEALAALAEYRDKTTADHLERIRTFVEYLTVQLMKKSAYSKYLRSTDSYIDDIGLGSILHDIAKVAIPDYILNKPGRLTKEEFQEVQKHTVIGGEMLAMADKQFRNNTGQQSYLTLAQVIAMFHHEKWDGSGYPQGLKGNDIPLAARITALCDVYDAVTSDRVYKKAWSHEEAVALVQEERGRHFDPVIADTFLKHHEAFRQIKEKNGKKIP